MRNLTQQEIDQAPDWANDYTAEDEYLTFIGEKHYQNYHVGTARLLIKVERRDGLSGHELPIIRKEFDISGHVFDFESVSKCDNELIEFHAYGCEKVRLSREDWIAGAKHFKLTAEDLK